MAVTWGSVFRVSIFLLLLAAIVLACFMLPIEKILKDFLLWIDQNVGRWGPLVLAVAYIPLTVLAVPASILTLGGGYLYGLLMGFIADSIGATIGATAAFLLGRTIGRSYVVSKLNEYPKFQAVSIAIERSGFKIAFLLRLAPLLPFNMLNYLLSVTPISTSDYVLSAWLGMMPLTLALVYAGTTVKDLSDVTHDWADISISRWVMIILSFVISVILMVCVTVVAKSSLEKALAEGPNTEGRSASPRSPIMIDPPSNAHQPLIDKEDHHGTAESPTTVVDLSSNPREPLINKDDYLGTSESPTTVVDLSSNSRQPLINKDDYHGTSESPTTVVDLSPNSRQPLINKEDDHGTSESPTIVDISSNSRQPLIIKGDPYRDILEL